MLHHECICVWYHHGGISGISNLSKTRQEDKKITSFQPAWLIRAVCIDGVLLIVRLLSTVLHASSAAEHMGSPQKGHVQLDVG